MKPSDFLTELSTDKLAKYKTAAAADASKADKEKDFARGDKRFSGIVKATKKQFDNDAKKGVAENVAGDVNSKKRYHFLYPHVPLDMHTDHEYNDLSDRDLQAVKSHQRELAYKLGKPGAKEQSDIASHIQINRARSQYDQEQAHRRKVLDAEKTKRQARDAKRQQGVAEGYETEADIDKQIEFHKQGQATAQYKGSMNKMHAKKIRDLEAKKAALKQGVAEGWKEGVAYTALAGLLSLGAISRVSDLVNSAVTGEPTQSFLNRNSGINKINDIKTLTGQGIESIKSVSSGGDKKFKMTLTDGREIIFTATDLERAKRFAAARQASEPIEVKEQGVAEGSERSIYKQAYMDGYNGKSFNSPYKPGSDEDDEYDEGWHDGRLDYEKQDVAEGWSQKYKSSINCSHPKGFSQKAHCAGKKKHNESIEMEMVCEDCGMCETHINHENLEEACWKGYHKEGNKKMFGKTYPNCVKNTNEEQEQHDESCPHCGGEMVSEELMNEKKDACYYKVKSRYKVWPSAYASGALVKCRNKGASNWGNSSKNESSILEGIEQADESLHDWFNKEKWVRMDTKGKIKGPCAREPGEGKPKCLPQSKAHSLGKKGRASAAARKRREDPNPDRSGKAINVNTKKTKG